MARSKDDEGDQDTIPWKRSTGSRRAWHSWEIWCTGYLKEYGYAPAGASVWRVKPRKSGPLLELSVTGHQEISGHTRYFVECSLQGPSVGNITWRALRRLCQLRVQLHDAVKSDLGDGDYQRYFMDTDFASRGGIPGTTARLHAWCGALAEGINAGNLPPRLAALVLQNLEAPDSARAPQAWTHRTSAAEVRTSAAEIQSSAAELQISADEVGTSAPVQRAVRAAGAARESETGYRVESGPAVTHVSTSTPLKNVAIHPDQQHRRPNCATAWGDERPSKVGSKDAVGMDGEQAHDVLFHMARELRTGSHIVSKQDIPGEGHNDEDGASNDGTGSTGTASA